jgi:hypothetical protein
VAARDVARATFFFFGGITPVRGCQRSPAFARPHQHIPMASVLENEAFLIIGSLAEFAMTNGVQ